MRPILFRLWFLGFFLATISPLFAQPIDTTFTLWLLNNEAQTMGILTQDREIIKRMSLPFGALTMKEPSFPTAENELWKLNCELFPRIRELSRIYSLLQKFNGGKFIRTIEKVQPGNWTTLPFFGLPASFGRKISSTVNFHYRGTLLKVLGVEKPEDANLNGRIERTIRELSEDERKLFDSYLDNFTALFPGDRGGKALLNLVTTKLRNEFAKKFNDSVARFFKPPVTPLAEENLFMPEAPNDDMALLNEIDLSTGTAAVDATSATDNTASGSESASPPPGDDVFNILH